MNSHFHSYERGTFVPMALGATILVGFIAIFGLTTILPSTLGPTTDMRIAPTEKFLNIGDTFTVDVLVESSIPVNVFKGELTFNNEILSIESIDYNTSIVDLWAEEPWYSNGAGTLNFLGGTTQKGGFFGTAPLITITFKTLREGAGEFTIRGARVMQHDGLGTDAQLSQPIDALFTVKRKPEPLNLLHQNNTVSSYRVSTDIPSTDLNDDGVQSLSDISIFMLKIVGNDTRYDFNQDGKVNTKDLSILLNAR